MTSQTTSTIRCAIYTRKSSEEGLEQSFNSLDAQREACEAFIRSQKQEGWQALAEHYDDGGYSGGTMDRPALKRLLSDVEARKVNTIVVYKVDRLTRSLADFAKIVEALDAQAVSFVSVTQQFNTTTSMGRLTLNVLLSFAQFEREVTGERIRDKIAASKRKGIWMGGNVPLGYDAINRELIVNREEAKLVQKLFERYLELGCVSRLKAELDHEGWKSKVRISAAGKRYGGADYARGGLYKILKNRVYLGEICHKGVGHRGKHSAIISPELWDRVQRQLGSEHPGRINTLRASAPSLLVGMMRDAEGNPFTPSHAVKNGKRYRYYVCQRRPRDPQLAARPAIRIPAHDLENLVCTGVVSLLQSPSKIIDQIGVSHDQPELTRELLMAAHTKAEGWSSMSPTEHTTFLRRVIQGVVVQDDEVTLLLSRRGLEEVLLGSDSRTAIISDDASQSAPIRLNIPARLKRLGGEVRLLIAPDSPDSNNSRASIPLINAIARAHDWYGRLINRQAKSQRELARQAGVDHTYVGRILRLAFLAPDIVETILAGNQPPHLTILHLTHNLPLSWKEQRTVFGFSN